MSVTLGYKVSAEQFDPRELLDLTIIAEAHGMESAFVSDHFQPWRRDGHAPFSLVWLAAAGERTTTIRLGTSALTPAYRYNPAVIAQAFNSLGYLYDGRVILGIGSGEALNEVAAGWDGPAGGQWPEFAERFVRLKESLEIIRKLWTDDRVNHSGDFYSVHDASIYDRPISKVPILIAAGGPRVAHFAGSHGDGIICTSGKGETYYSQEMIPAVRSGVEATGKAWGDFERMIEIKLSYEESDAAAFANLEFWSALSLPSKQKHSVANQTAISKAASSLSLEDISKRWIVGSDPDLVASQILEYIGLGFNHLVFHAPGKDQRRFLKLFARDIEPRISAYINAAR